MNERPPVPVMFCTTPFCIGLTVLWAIWAIFNIHKPIQGVPPGYAVIKAWNANADLQAYRAWERAEILAGRALPRSLGHRARWRSWMQEFRQAPLICTAMMALPVHAFLLLFGMIGLYFFGVCSGAEIPVLGAGVLIGVFSFPISLILSPAAAQIYDRRKRKRQ